MKVYNIHSSLNVLKFVRKLKVCTFLTVSNFLRHKLDKLLRFITSLSNLDFSALFGIWLVLSHASSACCTIASIVEGNVAGRT